MKKIITILTIAILFGCQEKPKEITDSKDYDHYLVTAKTPGKDAINKELDFWQNKFNNDSTNLMEMGRLAGIHAALYGSTGNISE